MKDTFKDQAKTVFAHYRTVATALVVTSLLLGMIVGSLFQVNNIVIGKRIPIGAATTGLIMFLGELWNIANPDAALAMSAWGGLAASITAIVQIIVVNAFGVTSAGLPKK